MNNISDKLVLTIILITVLFVFGLIFSVKSPERKVIDSPIMWKDDYSNIAIFSNKKNLESKRNLNKYSLFINREQPFQAYPKIFTEAKSIYHVIV